jgi:hypothetical protein
MSLELLMNKMIVLDRTFVLKGLYFEMKKVISKTLSPSSILLVQYRMNIPVC